MYRGEENKTDYLLSASQHTASKLWTDYSLGRSRNEREREKVAGRAGRGKGGTHPLCSWIDTW